MKKTRNELQLVENLVKRTYNRNGKKLREVLDMPFSMDAPLGYSFKAEDPTSGITVYTVTTSKLDDPYDSYRILMHEYGHVYLMHFEENYARLDSQISQILKTKRGQLIEMINKECGIDFAEKLIERVLDDPSVNHSIHNIAMDFEVNSKILSNEDIEEMEAGISKMHEREITAQLQRMKDAYPDNEKLQEEIDKKIKEARSATLVKLMLPSRYQFPDGLTYPEYLILVIEHLDKFVKMIVSLSQGGNGDTSEVSQQQVKDALSGGMQSLDDLMNQMGMLDKSGDQNGQQDQSQDGQGQRGDMQPGNDTSNSGGFKGNGQEQETKYKGIRQKDHMSPSREVADINRELGNIETGGGFGCGDGGGPDTLINTQTKDEVDLAIDEVMARTKSRVIKRQITRNIIRNYNLGKIRSVIAPSIIAKNRIDKKPKLVYIIDVSGSMDSGLIKRILNTISRKMKLINRGLRYDILTWSHQQGEWFKDIEPGKPIPHIRVGGGTSMADSLRFFKEHYDPSATFILISDFEDYLQEWCEVLKDMNEYNGWGFNYGRSDYNQVSWPKNFSVKNFNETYVGRY
jgi:hypothetical protein